MVDDAAEVVTAIFDEADPAAEAWVADKATAVLDGRARQVAADIRRRPTHHSLDPPRRINADRAAAYLTSKADYLDYPSALALSLNAPMGLVPTGGRHSVAAWNGDLRGAGSSSGSDRGF